MLLLEITSGSNNGDFSINHGGYDISILKYTPGGNLLWTKTYGGSGGEILGQLRATPDGGFIMSASSTSSASGDVTAINHGVNTRDAWIVKFDVNGIIQWQKLFGGSLNESGNIAESGGSIALCSDGGYVFSISSQSTNGDLAGLLPAGTVIGQDDIWLVKINSTGTILWQKAIGGSDADDEPHLYSYGNSIYLLFASKSFDRDLAGNLGIYDLAIFKYTLGGTLLWKNQYGSTSWDNGNAITGVKGDLLTIVGSCYSTSFAGIPISNYGQSSILVMRLDTLSGTIKWLKDLGGTNVDNANDVKITSSLELFVVGASSSNDYDITGNHGNFDGIQFKLDAGNNIRGTAFLDLNGNNIFDAGDKKPDYLKLQASKNNIVQSISLTTNGAFDIEVDTGNYSTKVKLWNSTYYSSVPDSFFCNFTNVNQSCSNNIALHPVSGIKDLRVSVFPTGIARPGTSTQYVLIGYNVGTQTIASGSISLKKDPRISYVNFSVPPNNITGDSITWNFTNLNPFDSLRYVIRITSPPPPTVRNWDTLTFVAQILPLTGDAYATDNTLVLKHIVSGSFDPNAKLNLHGNLFPVTSIQNGDYINYVIQFQNTGTAQAFEIIVNDTLSNKLQDATLEVLATSHPFTFTLKNKIASWKFSNINLPDSNTNEPASHGYIAFRIKAIPTLPPGDRISNKAAIYFDFNPAVLTANDTLNIITILGPLPPNPPVISPSADTSICSGSIILRSSVSSGNQWYKNNIAIIGAISDTLSVSQPGNYAATVTQNGLTSIFSATTHITMGSIAIVPLVNVNGRILALSNPSGTLTYTWQMLVAGTWSNVVPAATGVIYTTNTAGQYRVMASNGLCTVYSAPLSVSANVHSPGIFVHPNPADRGLVVDNIDLSQKWETLHVFNILGQEVLPITIIKNQTSVNLNLNVLSSGMYILKLTDANGISANLSFIKK